MKNQFISALLQFESNGYICAGKFTKQKFCISVGWMKILCDYSISSLNKLLPNNLEGFFYKWGKSIHSTNLNILLHAVSKLG